MLFNLEQTQEVLSLNKMSVTYSTDVEIEIVVKGVMVLYDVNMSIHISFSLRIEGFAREKYVTEPRCSRGLSSSINTRANKARGCTCASQVGSWISSMVL